MSAEPHEGVPAGDRAPLTRTSVVQAALALADAEGVDALTMRRLGASLGVGAMAVYRHVPGRSSLLDLVVESVVDGLYNDPQVRREPTDGDWQDYLRRLAEGLRRTAVAHPRVFPLVATRPPAAPWVRPPLRSLRWVERFLQSLLDAGFTREQAAVAYRSFTASLLGQLLLEVAAEGVDTGPVPADDTAPLPSDPLQDYPLLQEMAAELQQDRTGEEYALAVEALLERLETLRTTSVAEATAPG